MSVSCYISGWNVDITKTICYTLTDSMGNPIVIVCKSCRGDSAAFAVFNQNNRGIVDKNLTKSTSSR